MKSLDFFLKEVFINGFVTVKDDIITEAPAQDGSHKVPAKKHDTLLPEDF